MIFFLIRLVYGMNLLQSFRVDQVKSVLISNMKSLIFRYTDEQLMSIDKELKEIDQSLETSMLAIEAQ